jgi:hypothetical protein
MALSRIVLPVADSFSPPPGSAREEACIEAAYDELSSLTAKKRSLSTAIPAFSFAAPGFLRGGRK